MISTSKPSPQSMDVEDHAFKGRKKALEGDTMIDLDRLNSWLRNNVGAFSRASDHSTVQRWAIEIPLIRSPAPAVCLSCDANPSERCCRRRTPRPGVSGHLGPAPRRLPSSTPYALCLDPDVIGTTFYVMEMMEGEIYWNGLLPDVEPRETRADVSVTDRNSGAVAQSKSGYAGPR